MVLGDLGPGGPDHRDFPLHSADVADVGALGRHGGGPGQGDEILDLVWRDDARKVHPGGSPVVSY